MAVLLDKLDFIGKPIPLRYKVGEVVSIPLEFKTGTAATDITGKTWTVEVGPEGGSSALTGSIAIVSAVNGTATLTLDTSGSTAGNYVWEVWEDGDLFLWGGPVEAVAPDVS